MLRWTLSLPKREPDILILMSPDIDRGVLGRFFDSLSACKLSESKELRQSAEGLLGPDIKKSLQNVQRRPKHKVAVL